MLHDVQTSVTFTTEGLTLEAPAGARRAEPGEVPDVLVATGPVPSPRSPRVAVLAVDAPVALASGADLACTTEELNRDPAGLLRQAWAIRRLTRPLADDPDAEWLAALQREIHADELALVRRHTPLGRLTLEALGNGARFRVAAPASAVEEAVGLTDADGLIGASLADREPTWVVAVVSRDGAEWVRRALPVVRAAVDARDRATLADRLAEARATTKHHDENIRKLLSVLTHDLRNVFFPIQLALKVLERQIGTPKQMGTLARSVATGSDLVRRLADATWVFGGEAPKRHPSDSSDLAEVCAKVQKRVRDRYPDAQLNIVDVVAPKVVSFSEPVLEGIVHTLVSNAVAHGGRAHLTCSYLPDGSARVLVRNEGRLPFNDLAQIEPFQHRARGGLGLGLYAAHHLAAAQGLSLTVSNAADGHVEAVLTIPAEPTAEPGSTREAPPVE